MTNDQSHIFQALKAIASSGGFPKDGAKHRLPVAERLHAWVPAIEQAIAHSVSYLETIGQATQSPLEELLGLALWSHRVSPNKVLKVGPHQVWAPFVGAPNILVIEPQAEVGAYRTDFRLALARRDGSRKLQSEIFVEVDGHDFHEKTKEQAAHDKKRDRYFVSKSLPVLRFTGSEVYRDADACADEAVALLTRTLQVLK